MSSKFATFTAENLVCSTEKYEPIENVSVAEFLYQRFQQFDPETPFLIDSTTNEKLSYGDFMSKVHSMALAIVDLGAKPTDMIMFFDDNSLSHSVCYFAALFVGIPVWQTSPTYGAFEIAQRITNIPDKSVFFFYGSSRRALIKEMHQEYEHLVGHRIKLEIEMNRLSGENEDDPYGLPVCEFRTSDLIRKFPNAKLENLPYYPVTDVHESISVIVGTSGTTGPPKGAMHTQYSMVNFLKNISEQFKPNQGPKTLLYFAIGHISGAMYLPLDFCNGSTVYLASVMNADIMAELIHREGINQFLITPIYLYDIVSGNYEKKYDLSSLQVAYTGGAILPSKLADLWAEKIPHCPLLNFYAMTEFLSPLLSRNPEHKNSLEICGTVSPGTEMKIVCTETGKALPLNQSGEICLRGPCRFKGYYLNPEATKSAIDDEGFYHTGDVGYVDDDLCLRMQDRIRELIKVFGHSIFPTEIEQFIQLKFPQVSSVCVVGIPCLSGDTHPRAYIALREENTLSEEKVVDAVAAAFQDDRKHLKAGVVFISKMPRTLIGKVDRQYFKKLIQDGV